MRLRLIIAAVFCCSLFGCSLVLDKRADQCSSDDDCRRFAGTRCDMSVRLCVTAADSDGGSRGPGDGAGDAGSADALVEATDPCVGPNSCFQCRPASETQFRNACTQATCRPFDNKRVKHLLPEGGLSPLPE